MVISADNLRHLIDKLPGFNSTYSKPIYNPMEEFASYVVTKEIVHSKIIASLLNPSGGHGCGIQFLLEFSHRIGITIPKKVSMSMPNTVEPDISNIEVLTEYTIEKGRIDILLKAKIGDKKRVIIIENKLNDANYGDNQLERYKNAYINHNPMIVCIHRVKKGDEPEKADVVLYADDIAGIIDSVLLSGKDNPNGYNLQAYSSYLKNLGKQNIIMDNAKRLLNLTSEDMTLVKTLSEAYSQLPRAYAINLKKKALECRYDASIPTIYEEYCYIWNKNDYDNGKPFWIAIGFSQDSAFFYLVSDDLYGWSEEQKISSLNQSVLNIHHEINPGNGISHVMQIYSKLNRFILRRNGIY